MPRTSRRVGILLLLIAIFPGLAAGQGRLPKDESSKPWLIAQESGGILYFVQANPPRIKRYDVEAAAWRSDIVLGETPTAFTVDSQHLYVSFGRRTSRFSLNGTGEFHLKNTPSEANVLFVIGDFLCLGSYGSLWSVDKTSGSQIDFEEFFYSPQGIDVAPSLRKAFGRSIGVSPSDILVLEMNADGTFGELQDSPYHGDYPSAGQTYVFPGEARVADDSGIVYNTSDLTYSNSLGGAFDDLAFYGDLPIVLRGGEVIAYSNAFLETGSYKPSKTPLEIFVHGGQVFSFYRDGTGIGVEKFLIDLLEPAEPGQPVDPNGLAYEPDSMVVGKDDVVYLLSRANLSIFRWSIPQRRYLETIPLVEAPSYMAYSAETHRLYLSYPPGPIRQIHLAESTHETPFVNSPQTPCGLATAGEYLFVCDPSGAWVSHFTYSPAGELIAQREWNYYSEEYVWSEVNGRMYFFRDDTGPNDVHWEEIAADGSLGEEGESPYHGEIRTIHPLRVSPDGSTVVLGSGEIFDALTLERTDSLSNDIADAAWLLGTLFTIRPIEGGGSELQKWGANYGVSARRELAGEPLGLFGRRDHLLAVTRVNGVPRFSQWNSALGEFAGLPPLALGNGRFTVRAVWRTPDGGTGEGHAVPLTSDTGFFWFFNAANVEMVLKVLDGCAVNDRLWVFAGGLTNVEVEITVVDNQTGEIRTYSNPPGTPFQPIQDTNAFRGCSAAQSSGLESLPGGLASAAGLLLNNDRFDVEITWRTADGQNGTGHGVELTSDTGYYWFFGENNVEAVVKVLDGCAVNGRYWVFAGGLTNVETEIRITDTVTREVRTYTNPQGRPFQPIQDTGAFAHCP